MLLRLMLRYLFGQYAEVGGVPEKPDGFVAAATANHLLVIDNLDQKVSCLPDKLARLATGMVDSYRRLYTSNEVGSARYRCWLACTSRTPDTMRRDDLTDRLLILPLDRVVDGSHIAEREFLAQTEKQRNAFWGELISLLSTVITAIRNGELTSRAELRLADFESLGRLVARIEGRENVWDEFIADLKRSQSNLLLEEEPIIDAIDMWLSDLTNYGRKVTSREWYFELKDVLFGEKTPVGWYKSPKSFSRRLGQIRSDLQKKYRLCWETGTNRATQNRLVWWVEEGEE